MAVWAVGAGSMQLVHLKHRSFAPGRWVVLAIAAGVCLCAVPPARGLPTAPFEVPYFLLDTGTHPNAIALADLNRDGFLDIVDADEGDHVVSVHLGRGDGTFRDRATFRTGTGAHDLEVGDFNGDSIPDLAVTNDVTSTISILLGRGDGTFSVKGEYPASGSSTGRLQARA